MNPEGQIDKLARMIASVPAGKPVVAALTGAGISSESGIPTFRGEDGLWKNYRAVELATPQAYASNPELVWEWYEWRRELVRKAGPNPGHLALAKFEKLMPQFHVITQNVDGLHKRAGTKKVIELHGNLFTAKCSGGRCSPKIEIAGPMPKIPDCPSCGKLMRPDVVWFGESLAEENVEASVEICKACHVMLIVGTSAVVYPAAGLPGLVKEGGGYLSEINVEDTPMTAACDFSFRGLSGEILPRLLERVEEIRDSLQFFRPAKRAAMINPPRGKIGGCP